MAWTAERNFELILQEQRQFLEDSGIELFKMLCADNGIFRLYGPNGGLCSSLLVILMLAGPGKSRRFDGGELPRRNQLIQDEDGWIFAAIELTANQLEFGSLNACSNFLRARAEMMLRLKQMSFSTTGIKKIQARLGLLRHRMNSKVQAFLAA